MPDTGAVIQQVIRLFSQLDPSWRCLKYDEPVGGDNPEYFQTSISVFYQTQEKAACPSRANPQPAPPLCGFVLHPNQSLR